MDIASFKELSATLAAFVEDECIPAEQVFVEALDQQRSRFEKVQHRYCIPSHLI